MHRRRHCLRCPSRSLNLSRRVRRRGVTHGSNQSNPEARMKANVWTACAVGMAAIAACGGTAQEMGMEPTAAATNLVSATAPSILARNIDASVPEGGGVILFKGSNLSE